MAEPEMTSCVSCTSSNSVWSHIIKMCS